MALKATRAMIGRVRKRTAGKIRKYREPQQPPGHAFEQQRWHAQGQDHVLDHVEGEETRFADVVDRPTPDGDEQHQAGREVGDLPGGDRRLGLRRMAWPEDADAVQIGPHNGNDDAHHIPVDVERDGVEADGLTGHGCGAHCPSRSGRRR